MYCKPTFIHGYFISRFFCDKLVRNEYFSRPTIFHSYRTILYIWFTTRNIRDNELGSHELAKFSRSRIKVGLQYTLYI
jgi:hypothetical protein